MSKAVVFLLVAALGLGIVSMHLVRELRAEREQSQTLQARIEQLERVARSSPRAPAPMPPPFSPFDTQLSAVESRPVTTSAARPPAASAVSVGPNAILASTFSSEVNEDTLRQMREHEERQRALLQDPEYREAMRAQHRIFQRQTYPDVGEELGLSEDELERFMELLADQQLRAMDTMPPMQWSNSRTDPAAIEEAHRKMQQQQQLNETEQANALGQAKYQAWKEYQSTLGQRHQVAQMRTTFAGKGAPLQESQIKPLIKALAQEQQRQMMEWRIAHAPGNVDPAAAEASANFVALSSVGGFVSSSGFIGQNPSLSDEKNLEAMRQSNKRLRDALSGVLTSEQLKLLETEHEEQLKMQQVQTRIMRAQNRAQH